MAIKIGGTDEDIVEATDINITPFIDDMLVLLIIFMVAAPLATADLPVNLPTVAAEPAPRPEKAVILTLKSDLSVLVDQTPVTGALGAALMAASAGNLETPLYLGADEGVAYGDLMAVMNEIRAQGFRQIGLVGLEAPK